MTLDVSQPGAAATQPSGTTGPWQGGFSVPVAPPVPPQFGSATVMIAHQSGDTGVLVSYSDSIFTRQYWSAGGIVPLLIQVLEPSEVAQLRDQVAEQLDAPGSGLDDIPLRAFVEVADVFLHLKPSGRFAEATFGSIAPSNPGELLGVVDFPNSVTGTVLGSTSRVSAQTHLPAVPVGDPTPLRLGDLRSLVSALETALATQTVDPLWQHMLSFAKQVLAATAP